MNRKTLLTSALCFVVLFIASIEGYSQTTFYAQDSDLTQDSLSHGVSGQKKNYNAYKTTWKKNRFKDTWFITLGSGAQLLMAEDDDKGPLGSRITYAPTISVGKFFSPIWGLRVQLTGGSLHGFNDGESGTYRKWNSGSKNYQGNGYADRLGMTDVAPGSPFMTWDPSWNRRGFSTDATDPAKKIVKSGNSYVWLPGQSGSLYMQHIRYTAANFNFMFNFLTMVGDYNPKRAFEITPFAGLSYAHVLPSEGQGAYDTFGANGGLNFKVRLSDKFDFNMEGAVTLYPDDFDGHTGGVRSMDIVTQATAGITYKIGKSTWEVADPMNYEMIQTLNEKINDLKVQVAEANRPCPDCPPCPEVVVVDQPTRTTDQITFLPDPVFFRIDKSIIDASEWNKIEKAANYLRNNPMANVIVTGYADRQTAYPAYNMRLSERRAKIVSKALIDKYGVNPMRISINWEGDRTQPFEINEWNRVVIFVIDK